MVEPERFNMPIDQTSNISDPPILLTVAGTAIGGASEVMEDLEGALCFEGLDGMARIFFAERVGPGGPGDDIKLRDVSVWDGRQRRTLRAAEARVRHFSAGTGELELIAAFRDT
jgi:hypothetical protein